MHIVHIATELSPIAKVGGLGDVVHGLSKEMVRKGHQIDILLPKYDIVNYQSLNNLHVKQRELWAHEGVSRYHNTIWGAEMEGLNLLFVEPHHPAFYFSRGTIYGCHDDVDRFIYLCIASVEYLLKLDKQPDVLHLHDWPSAIAALLYMRHFSSSQTRAKTVLTIHNLHHQGRCSPDHLLRLGLKPLEYFTPKSLQDPHSPQHINLLKGGIEYADALTVVSPNYEKEILTIAGGCGLHKTLQQHHQKVTGILNGIDEHFWNPNVDPHLIEHYRAQPFEETLKGKIENKKQLRRHFNLADINAPLVASVTRLVPQKGPDLIEHALLKTLDKGGQFILLGSALPHSQERMRFEKLKDSLAKNKQAAISLDYDEALSHLIFAAADIFIIPSLFEPCGLTQMIALRYGTVPIARMTGGLVDTVFDIDTSTKPFEQRNGYTFDFPDNAGVDWALERALECYQSNKEKWHKIMQQGMKYDFSWKKSALEYLRVYTHHD